MIGQQVGGKYELLRLIGEGGLGAVYEAKNTDTGRHVAVKLITDAVADDEAIVARFEREAQSAGKIVTPHIVEVLDTGRDPKSAHPYIVMELLQGESVGQLLGRLGPLKPDLAARIAAQVCLGLQKAHEAGVVHRDIKPTNLFLAKGDGPERTVKLLDFGVAKLKMEHASTTGNESLARTGSMEGSPLYMSPEQARGLKTIDHRADIWSLGIVLSQMLCGTAPHTDATGLGDLIIAICAEEPPSVRERAPWVPESLAEAVHGALRLAAEDRYPTAKAMLGALSKCLVDGWKIDAAMLVAMTDAERRAPGTGAGGAEAAVGEGATVALEATPDMPTKQSSAAREGAAPGRARGTGAPIAVKDADTVEPNTRIPGRSKREDDKAAGAAKDAVAAAVPAPASPLDKTTPTGPAPNGASRGSEARAPEASAKRAAEGAGPARPAPAARGSSGLRALVAIVAGAAFGIGGTFALNILSPNWPLPMGKASGKPARSAARAAKPTPTTAASPRQPSSAAAVTSSSSAPGLEPSAAPSGSASAAPEPAGTTMRVGISPPFAGVTVDGEKREVKNGFVEITGELDSVHDVVVTLQNKPTAVKVKLTAAGPQPPTVTYAGVGRGKLPRPDIYE